MAKKSISEIVTEIVPIVEQVDYELVDVEYVKEGSSWFLSIYHKPGVT